MRTQRRLHLLASYASVSILLSFDRYNHHPLTNWYLYIFIEMVARLTISADNTRVPGTSQH